MLGLYRKSHIPAGPGYQEKYYFTPGDTAFKVWKTRFGIFGCRHLLGSVVSGEPRAPWRCMGAEALFYPDRHRTEPPPAPPVDSRDHWRRVMQGHAAANCMPLVASNRIGTRNGEGGRDRVLRFVIHRDQTGAIAAELGRGERGDIASFDLDEIARPRLMGIVPRPQAGSLWCADRS